jgi:long-chain fatty acid transport protein
MPRTTRTALALRPLLAAVALLPLALTAQAAGYRFGTQSAAAEGTANANGAEAADASTLFANPAGITRLKGWNFSGVIDYVDPKTRFTDAGSYISLPGSGFAPRSISTAGDSMSFAKAQPVPHAYLSYQGDDGLAYGLGMFVPWGTKLNYPANWGGRYNLQSVELKSLSINPNVAWKASPELSLAAGLNIQYMEGKLRRAVPYASVYAAGLLNAAHQAAVGGAPGLALQLQQQAAQIFGDPSYDGSIAVEGKNWGLGFNLALLWEPAAGTRVGLSYRSSVGHKLKGSADWTQPGNLPATVLAAITAAPYNGVSALDHNDSDASLSVRTPESLSVHGFQQLTPTVAIMGDFTITRDSRLNRLIIDFANTTADSTTAEHWKDSTKVSVGAQWKALPSLMLRTGYARDMSPVPSETRGPALPDAARTWLALGANWAFMDNASVDFSYGHVKLKDAAMSATDDGDGVQPCNCAYSTVRGNYASKATIYGVQFNYKF